MSSTKIIVVILMIFALLFFGSFGLGILKSQDMSAEEFAKTGQFPHWVENIGDLLAPVAPKVELKPSTLQLNPGQSKVITIPKSDCAFRVVTLKLNIGAILETRYLDMTPDAGNLDFDKQILDLPHQKRGKNHYRGSVVVLKAGGTLQLSCKGIDSCQVVFD
ncbi:MAG: hypothetical protein AB4426_12365 [Xenococcaceae cyanobacterium]